MLNRRNWLLAGSLAMASLTQAQARRVGHLVIVGGAMDLHHDKTVLRRFVELSGGPRARIRVITAASADPLASWASFESAFATVGVQDCQHVAIADRSAADSGVVREQLLEADGIFITGGDQSRLMGLVWETQAFAALHTAFHIGGCCVGGTSAGAAVMSRHMLAQGEATRLPEKEVVDLDLGLGFVSRAIVDQHFSERGRLARLLSAVAQRPDLLGVGIDEDTALVIERASAIEVIGKGAVTVVDGRQMHTNANLIEARERLEMLGVRLHLLPAGRRYSANPRVQRVQEAPHSLHEVVNLLVQPGPIRS